MAIQQLSAEETRLIASRQLLSFLFLPDEEGPGDETRRAPSKELFSVDQLPESAFTDQEGLFNWRTRPIYDVDRALLFWDHTLSLGSDNELHVRTAASDVLRTPVWSIGAGSVVDVPVLTNKVLEFVEGTHDLKPILIESEVRLICYGYPRLGILCSSDAQPAQQFIVDLFDLNKIPVVPSGELPAESVKTIWSPYDSVTRGTRADYRSRWRRDLSLLPDLPKKRETLREDVKSARRAIIEERTTNPELIKIGQKNDHFCAAATAKMILRQHRITQPTQEDIAFAMDTDPVNGATPQNQRRAIRPLSHLRLKGVLDQQASFSDAKNEIRNNRPFKVGAHSHARACGGFKIEVGPKEFLYIYDPLPTGGRVYHEPWEATRAVDFMYVQPILNS
jgi:hypothetical protein